MTTISGALRSNGNKTESVLRAFAMSSVLGLSCLVPLECTLAEEQHAPLTPAETDTEIASLLSRIEAALAQDHEVSAYPLIEMSFAAKSLQSSASTEGRRLINDFPARLQKHAEQESDGGNTMRRINLITFAESFTSFFKPYASESARSSSVRQDAITPDPPNTSTAGMLETTPAAVVAPTSLPRPDSPKAPAANLGTAAAPAAAPTTAPSLDQSNAPAPVKLETPKPDSPKPPPGMPASVQRTLVDRGNAMLSLGDVSAARMLFTRAAESGIGIAAFKLANTYDPVFLRENNLLGIKPDPAAAEAWYRKAAAMGEVEAEQRLKSLKGHSLSNAVSTQ